MKPARIIFIKGPIETLTFFSLQIAEALEEQGLETWFWDMKSPLDSRETFLTFHDFEHTVLLTFNFIGLNGESQFQSEPRVTLWEQYHIRICCIMVDHPMYYFRQLSARHSSLTLFCIDWDHQAFMEHFYPEYGRVHFLPLAGTMLPEPRIPYSERETDVIFAGNYAAPENLTRHIRHMDEECREFYFDLIQEFLSRPDQSLEQVLIRRLKEEFPQITREETLSCLHNMTFIDLYVRSWFRRNIILSLAEEGIPVLVLGKDWELSGCSRPKNLLLAGQQDSRTCLSRMRHAKISVNIMPWFKKGAHDRIFNSMLQGCAVVTDYSDYLREILKEGQDSMEFTLEQYQEIGGKVRWLLSHPQEAEAMAEEGYRNASRQHTWNDRACTLLKIISHSNE